MKTVFQCVCLDRKKSLYTYMMRDDKNHAFLYMRRNPSRKYNSPTKNKVYSCLGIKKSAKRGDKSYLSCSPADHSFKRNSSCFLKTTWPIPFNCGIMLFWGIRNINYKFPLSFITVSQGTGPQFKLCRPGSLIPKLYMSRPTG